jgi:hypothetical protein
MKRCLLVAVLALVLATPVYAQVCAPALRQPLGIAPDACGPGFYAPGPTGMIYGPNYYLQPPWPPYTFPLGQGGGMGGPGGMGGGPAAFPTHPFARSPRDFFMWTEAQEELSTRERLPLFVP